MRFHDPLLFTVAKIHVWKPHFRRLNLLRTSGVIMTKPIPEVFMLSLCLSSWSVQAKRRESTHSGRIVPS